jgi:hypothetical protein
MTDVYGCCVDFWADGATVRNQFLWGSWPWKIRRSAFSEIGLLSMGLGADYADLFITMESKMQISVVPIAQGIE